MDVFIKVILVILIFLATSSGITKIMLMPQDVAFFGGYGFTNPILIAYGATQLIGGVLLIFKNTRFIGALIIAVTFLISAIVLIMAGKMLVALITFITMFMLGIIMYNCWRKRSDKP